MESGIDFFGGQVLLRPDQQVQDILPGDRPSDKPIADPSPFLMDVFFLGQAYVNSFVMIQIFIINYST
jgi:hypothetical protein